MGGCTHECACVNACGHLSTWRVPKQTAPKSSEGGGYLFTAPENCGRKEGVSDEHGIRKVADIC